MDSDASVDIEPDEVKKYKSKQPSFEETEDPVQKREMADKLVQLYYNANAPYRRFRTIFGLKSLTKGFDQPGNLDQTNQVSFLPRGGRLYLGAEDSLYRVYGITTNNDFKTEIPRLCSRILQSMGLHTKEKASSEQTVERTVGSVLLDTTPGEGLVERQ